MNPLISVVIPCYNRERFIKIAVESVLDQTHSNLECIIIDDGSSDNTADICKAMALEDHRIKYFYQSNGGISSARNRGIKESNGEWIQFLDSDDWLAPDKFRFQLEYLASKNIAQHDNIILHTDFQVAHLDENLKTQSTVLVKSDNFTNQQLLDRILAWSFTPDLPIHTNSLLYNRNVFNARVFKETDYLICEDLDLFVHLLLTDVSMIYTPIMGSEYRLHAWAITANIANNKDAYIGYLESIYETDNKLLCSNPNIGELIKRALWGRDKKTFNRLTRINQDPVQFRYITTKNARLMRTIFWVRSRLGPPLGQFIGKS